jgi:hypothetical protein
MFLSDFLSLKAKAKNVVLFHQFVLIFKREISKPFFILRIGPL